MGLTAFRVAYAGAVGILSRVVIIVGMRGRPWFLGVYIRRVGRECGVVVRVCLDLIAHDGRYACIAIVSYVTTRLNKVFGGLA